MNAISNNKEFTETTTREPSVSANETYWGYILRCQNRARSLAILMQWTAAFVGVSLLFAAFGFWTLPGSAISSDILGFKLGISTIMGIVGITLVWFASHGTENEFQVDLARSEVREVLRNRQGNARVLSRTKFGEIDAVFIDRATTEHGKSRLMLRLADSALAIEVAIDYEEHLTRLRDRLAYDILGDKIPMRAKANRGFMLKEAKGVIKPVLVA
ncbi:MAG: hypothetical protein COB39_12830 [Marinosulfonomonas sp.]|nr:MAG: hypothetical protein COB39_12830 [Marinosulfonomonas sp.]